MTAGDFAETVWTGRATAHIRKIIESHIELSDLQKIWAIVSPLNFVGIFADNNADLLIVSERRDQVVLFRLAAEFVRALKDAQCADRLAGFALRSHARRLSIQRDIAFSDFALSAGRLSVPIFGRRTRATG